MNRRSFFSKAGALFATAGTFMIIQAEDDGVRKATISLAKCVGCGDCVRSCPVKAISLEKGKAVVNHDTCVGCRLCVATCSYGAPR